MWRRVPHCWRVYLLLVRTTRDDKLKWRRGRDSVLAPSSGGPSEGWSGSGLPLFSISGAHSWIFRLSFMLTLAPHSSHPHCFWRVCYQRRSLLTDGGTQWRAGEGSSATPALGGSGLLVAQEVPSPMAAEFDQNLKWKCPLVKWGEEIQSAGLWVCW